MPVQLHPINSLPTPQPTSQVNQLQRRQVALHLKQLGRVHHPLRRRPSQTKCSLKEEVSLDSLLISTEVDEGFVSLINSGRIFSKAIILLKQVLIVDSGGQPEFLEMMPVFLNGASKFVYVMKVHEALEKRTMIRYFQENKLVWEFPASHTNEDILKQCTRTMRSLNAKNPNIPPSKIMILATHRDMVLDKDLSGVLEHLHNRLKEILLPEFKEQLIFCDSTGEDFIFVLNAANPDDNDKECGQAIRKSLSKSDEKRKPVKVPLRWYTLYQKLLEVMNGLGKKVLSREQCQKVAESIDIDERSCEEALNFFNGLNVLFYFPTHLPNLVFIEPQMLLDKVSELVDETYHMRQGKKLEPMVGERLKFRDYGQVTEQFLSEFKSHYEPPLFTPKELITLLKGLLVLADLSENVYFMPCLLRVESSEVVSKHRVSKEKALAVHFPNSGPLMGMFCCTVAHLLSPDNTHPCPWKVVQNKEGTPECLHRNVIQFTIPNMPGAISLIDHFTHFEIHASTIPKKTAQLWKMVQDAVFTGMKNAGKTLGYTNNTPVPAIVCPAHPDKPHPATVDEDAAWTCSVTPQDFGQLKECTIPWLSLTQASTSLIPSTTPPPTSTSQTTPPASATQTTLSTSTTQTATPLSSTTQTSLSTSVTQTALPTYTAQTATPLSSTTQAISVTQSTSTTQTATPLSSMTQTAPPTSTTQTATPLSSTTQTALPTSTTQTATPLSSTTQTSLPITITQAAPPTSTTQTAVPSSTTQTASTTQPSSTTSTSLSTCTSITLSSVPRLSQLKLLHTHDGNKIEIINTIATHWKDIGDLLDFDISGTMLERIEANEGSRGVESCCRSMFQHWLKGNGVAPVSWDTLLRILKNTCFSRLATQLETEIFR